MAKEARAILNHTTPQEINMTDRNENRALDQARAQLDCVRAMVAALEVDYDRLEELRDERDELREANEQAATDYDELCADPDVSAQEIDEARATLVESERALMDWIEESQEELEELEEAADGCEGREDAEQRIHEDALSVEVRSAWVVPGAPFEADEYRIVLCTGGPHVEIRGTLGAYGEPDRADLYYADWFETPQALGLCSDEAEDLLTYAQRFYLGS